MKQGGTIGCPYSISSRTVSWSGKPGQSCAPVVLHMPCIEVTPLATKGNSSFCFLRFTCISRSPGIRALFAPESNRTSRSRVPCGVPDKRMTHGFLFRRSMRYGFGLPAALHEATQYGKMGMFRISG